MNEKLNWHRDVTAACSKYWANYKGFLLEIESRKSSKTLMWKISRKGHAGKWHFEDRREHGTRSLKDRCIEAAEAALKEDAKNSHPAPDKTNSKPSLLCR